MIQSLMMIFLVGLSMSFIFSRIKLPKIIGMLITGIVLGPYVLNLLDPDILNISTELRQIALIIILIKAGLSLNICELKKVGRPALLMSFVPALFEIGAITLFAPILLNISYFDSAIMGTVLAAVSPAVVVPRMVNLIENNYGTNKQIPQMILAGASIDDIFVIVIFTSLINMSSGDKFSILNYLSIPVSIITGVVIGSITGIIISAIFESFNKFKKPIRQSIKVIVILTCSFLMISVENWLENLFSMSGLLAVLSLACIIQIKCKKDITDDLSKKFGKIWLAAEILLFVLVGAAVDIRYTFEAGLNAIYLILIALVIRSLGVYISLIGTNLSNREKLYCVFAYLPKATVQAAIGSIPLSMGLACGSMVLSVAVLSILITAPLGAILMDLSYKKLLNKR